MNKDNPKKNLSFELPTIRNLNLSSGLARLRPHGLHLLNNVHPLNHLPKHHVLIVEPRSLGRGDEELRAVAVRPGVGHAQQPRLGVLQGEVLILELLPIDGSSPCAVLRGEIATLAHEVGYDPVEDGTFVAESLLSGAQGSEVFGRFRGHVRAEFHHYPAQGLAIRGEVHENLG